MACFLPGTGTLAIIAFSAYLIWHKVIGHFLAIAGVVAGPVIVAGAATAAAGLVIWSARVIRRRRARAGACTTCRFGCQQALPHRHLLVNRVNRVDRRRAGSAGGLRPVAGPAPGPARFPGPVSGPAAGPARGAATERVRWPHAGGPVAFGGYVLTPDGAERAAAVPAQASASTRANAST